MDLQDRVCDALAEREGRPFREDVFPRGAGLSRPRVLEGNVIERGGVNFSHTVGAKLPAAATERRPELEGASFQAVSMSWIVHPANPYAPTCHANYRFFEATSVGDDGEEESCWWFGGGFDLTPYYGFDEDCVHWHETARQALEPFRDELGDLYPRFKSQCDEYFFLRHRQEPRGIGGVFFDDFAESSFERCFAMVRSLGDAFLPAYLPILDRRRVMEFGERQREFQLYRRGRYVEFNLIYDRGTRFGLQAAGRAESILVSMPPRVRWTYDYTPEEGSQEARLYDRYLTPRDWLQETSG
ncbi:MAG: oxygen-dependent coproporphyrinogen oxidase [Thermoanaerobaculia bacterium]|nr:oxygen-dependent coproporphyrinogen oxidase [Thermoanaerobaculia bacterium]